MGPGINRSWVLGIYFYNAESVNMVNFNRNLPNTYFTGTRSIREPYGFMWIHQLHILCLSSKHFQGNSVALFQSSSIFSSESSIISELFLNYSGVTSKYFEGTLESPQNESHSIMCRHSDGHVRLIWRKLKTIQDISKSIIIHVII